MEKLSIDVVENATKTVSFLPETPFEKVLADCMTDYLEMRKAEEQGLLLRLPCKVGTQVWKIKECSGGGRISNWHEIYNVNFALELLSDFGKTVFLTKEEAEQALAEVKEV